MKEDVQPTATPGRSSGSARPVLRAPGAHPPAPATSAFMRTAVRGWATTQQARWWTAGAFLTKSRISAFSERRVCRRPVATTRRLRYKRWPGDLPTTSWTRGPPSRAETGRQEGHVASTRWASVDPERQPAVIHGEEDGHSTVDRARLR